MEGSLDSKFQYYGTCKVSWKKIKIPIFNLIKPFEIKKKKKEKIQDSMDKTN